MIKKDRGFALKFLILLIALFAAFLYSFLVGRYDLSVGLIWDILRAQIMKVPAYWEKTLETVVIQVRLPRICCAILVGGALSVSGASYQTLFKNPMVSPDLLGVSAGASFGAALCMLQNGRWWQIQLSAKKRARHIAYVPQSSALSFPYCVRDVVLMGRLSHMATGAAHSAEDKRVVMECLERLQISHLADCSFQELSGGEKQMVLVARGLAQQSSLLVMDEPTASLDYSNQIRILKTIRSLSAQGYTILMTTHFPDHAFLACTVAALMRGGYVAAYGPPDEVVTSESLSELYQSKVCVTEADIGGKTAKVCMPLMD